MSFARASLETIVRKWRSFFSITNGQYLAAFVGNMFKVLIAVFSAILLAGCASTFGTVFNRPVVEDSVKDVLSTMSSSADRRTVVVITDGKNKGKFCAEPPPDTATGLKTELDAGLEAKAKSERLKAEAEGKLILKERLETTLVVLAERTPALDALRTGVYALYQFHFNGAISDADVKPIFLKLVESFEAIHKALPV